LEGCNDSDTLLCDNDLEEQLNQEKYEELTGPSITLHVLSGWTTPKTTRIAAMIGSCIVIILIDSGSSHNFISERTANLLRLPVVPTETFTIHVANGESLKCRGRFEEVPVDLQGIVFSLTLYSLPFIGLDVVLGIQWLELLGSMICDWKRLTMEFLWENQPRRLTGIDRQDIKEASL
jgi:hypothetical protein